MLREAFGWCVLDVNVIGNQLIKTPFKNLLKGRFLNGVFKWGFNITVLLHGRMFHIFTLLVSNGKHA